jgi:hypothetical protein
MGLLGGPDGTNATGLAGFVTDWTQLTSDLEVSDSEASSVTHLSPFNTPQHRLGNPIEVEEPLTPNSLGFCEEIRRTMNDMTNRMVETGAREGVVLYGMQGLLMNFQQGKAF